MIIKLYLSVFSSYYWYHIPGFLRDSYFALCWPGESLSLWFVWFSRALSKLGRLRSLHVRIQ